MFKVCGLALAVLFLVAVGFLYFVRVEPSTVTKENVVRIKNGMTKEEVIALLGNPDTAAFKGTLNPGEEAWNEGRDPFASSGAMIVVRFDANDHVVGKSWSPPNHDECSPPSPGVLERLIRWIN
jgi:hypothetical protein